MSVGWKQVLVFLDKVVHVLVKTEESGITSGSLEMFEHTWLELKVVIKVI